MFNLKRALKNNIGICLEEREEKEIYVKKKKKRKIKIIN